MANSFQNHNRQVTKSIIAPSADIENGCEIINSKVGERCWIGQGTRFNYSQLGNYSYISRNSNIFSSSIEKFCSISWDVSIGPANHDFRRTSCHAMFFAERFGMLYEQRRYYDQYEGDVTIGNDVWIGCGATILRDVTIGDGAIIGAGSIITKSVEPYTIIVGNNRILRRRFSEDIIEKLLSIKWWTYNDDLIRSNIFLISQEPTMQSLEELEYRLNAF